MGRDGVVCDTGFIWLCFGRRNVTGLFGGDMDLIRFVDFSRQVFFFDKLITLSPFPLSSL